MKRIGVILFGLFAIGCLCMLGYSGYHLVKNWQEREQHEKQVEELTALVHPPGSNELAAEQGEGEIPVELAPGEIAYPDGMIINWSGMDEINPYVVCWLYVPGTDISFPVVHPDSAEGDRYYINHSYDGVYDIYGSIFIEHQNQLTDDNIVIYGHSTDVGSMFSSLGNYQYSDYFQSYNQLFLYWRDGNMTQGRAIDFLTVDIYSPIYSYTLVPESLALLSEPAEKIITLSTCNLYYGIGSIQRLAVVFKVL